jgi:hypothetical protein
MNYQSRSALASAPARHFDRRTALRSIGLSLTINALCPFLVYRVLEPHFPPGSVMPLLYATVFPIFGLVLSLVRKRAADAIAILAMAGLAIHIVVTLIAPTVGIALVIRSLDGTLIGLAFVISALVGRPIILLVARQVVAGGSPEQTASLKGVIENDGQRVFFTITMVWGGGLIAMSVVHVLMALEMAPADFLLASPVVGVATILALIAWSGRYVATRMRPMPARDD